MVTRVCLISRGSVAARALALSALVFLTSAFSGEVSFQRLGALATYDSATRPEVAQTVRVPAGAFEYMLPAPQVAELEKAKSAKTNAASPALQIGFGRSASVLNDAKFVGANLKWQRLPNGDRITGITVGSAQAEAVRLALHFVRLDPRVRFAFADAKGDLIGQTDGMAIADQVLQGGEFKLGMGGGLNYVTPVAIGDRLSIAVTVPASVDTDDGLFSVNWVSHFEQSPLSDMVRENPQSLACQRNIACASGSEQTTGKSVARMVYSDPTSGLSYTCTGTLLNNRNQDRAPYFLTANHCIDNQSMASTLQTYWFYESSSCQGTSVSSTVRTLSGGGTLLYTSATTDTTLLQLGQSPPQGATFAGWDPAQWASSSQVFGVHHPGGEIKKISYGINSGYLACSTLGSSASYSCSPSTAASGAFYNVRWFAGATEGGSSGSGLFYTSGESHYLIGQLKGGSEEKCIGLTSVGISTYGRFDVAFGAGLSRWLSPTVSTVSRTAIYRFYNQATGTHFFTGSSAERDQVIATLPSFRYEGTAFYAYSSAANGTSAVYRFYNTTGGSHFFTISAAERDVVVAGLKHYSMEGTAWYAGTTADAQSAPLYRFYNVDTGTHFYTVSSDERDHIIANLKNYRYEGVAYHVWRSQ